jgi:hypothetical protein
VGDDLLDVASSTSCSARTSNSAAVTPGRSRPVTVEQQAHAGRPYAL